MWGLAPSRKCKTKQEQEYVQEQRAEPTPAQQELFFRQGGLILDEDTSFCVSAYITLTDAVLSHPGHKITMSVEIQCVSQIKYYM